jgi:hypothetical protein
LFLDYNEKYEPSWSVDFAGLTSSTKKIMYLAQSLQPLKAPPFKNKTASKSLFSF